MEVIIVYAIIISVIGLLYLLVRSKKITKIETEEYTKSPFALCVPSSIQLALAYINELHQNNQRDKRYYKTYRTIQCRKEDLIRSFYFLKDCIVFCHNNKKIYNNEKLRESLEGLHQYIYECYLDVESDELPFERMENSKFGQAQWEIEKLSNTELDDLKLIDWREKEHWQYWADAYGKESVLGKYCFEQVLK